jgi:hypothetical protein
MRASAPEGMRRSLALILNALIMDPNTETLPWRLELTCEPEPALAPYASGPDQVLRQSEDQGQEAVPRQYSGCRHTFRRSISTWMIDNEENRTSRSPRNSCATLRARQLWNFTQGQSHRPSVGRMEESWLTFWQPQLRSRKKSRSLRILNSLWVESGQEFSSRIL